MMTVLEKIKTFFKRPKTKAKVEEPKVAVEAAEKKQPETPEKKA
jgi:hypothetical protein